MGLENRPYWRDEEGGRPSSGGFARGVSVGMPKPTSVVKWLLLINIAVFLLQIITSAASGGRDVLESVFGVTGAGWWQLWRYFSFQFLHSQSSFFHIGLNMLGLYMLGTPLEHTWGSRKFLRFYLTCGVAAGVAYAVMANLMHLPGYIPLIGASGGVYGVVLACAVLFPGMRLIFFLFPVPIRMAALIIFGGMILMNLSALASGQLTDRFWSDVAHLGGAGMAAILIWVLPSWQHRVGKIRRDANAGTWQRKMQQRQREQDQVDLILEKIQQKGITSLTEREKKILQDASKRQRQEERESYRNS